MKKAFIYQLISKSNKSYIGSTTTSLEKRLNIHLTYLEKQKHPNKRLQGAFNKYNDFQVNILEEFNYENKQEVIDKEQYYLDTLNPEYNILKKAYSPTFSDKTKEKISNSLKGKKFSDERKYNISKGKKGKLVNHSIEGKKNISKSVIERCSIPIIGINIHTKEIKEFNSQQEAQRELKITGISNNILKREPASCKGWTFKFKSDETDIEEYIKIAFIKLNKENYKEMGREKLISINKDTNEILNFNYIGDCFKHYKCSENTIRRAMRANKPLKNTNIYIYKENEYRI